MGRRGQKSVGPPSRFGPGIERPLFLLWLGRCTCRWLRGGGSGDRGGRRRSGHGEIDRQRRHQFVQLLQHFVRNIEALVEKHQVCSLKYQICLAISCDIGNDFLHLLLDFGERVAIRFLQGLALPLDIAFEIVDLLLEFTALLVERIRRHRCLLPL
jgi:hypothetical protein